MRLSTLLILVASSFGSALACPHGTVPQQGNGWQGCAPVPGTGPTPATQTMPKEVWEDRWGAIAANEDNIAAGIGSATGMKRKGQAERAALKECESKGIAGCKVKFAYYSQCAVIVWGDRGSTISGASSVERAEKIGLEECKSSGDTGCETFFSACSYPVRVR